MSAEVSASRDELAAHAALPTTVRIIHGHIRAILSCKITADSFDPRGLRSDMHPWVNVHRVTPWPAQDGQRIPVGYSHIL